MSPAMPGQRSTPLQHRVRPEFPCHGTPHGGVCRRLAVSVAIVSAAINTVMTRRSRRQFVPLDACQAPRSQHTLFAT